MAKKKVSKAKPVKKSVSKGRVHKAPAKKKLSKAIMSQSIFRKPSTEPVVVEKPVKAKKNYKLPNYKKKCIECANFKFIKGGWSLCMQCYEKRYGKYLGEDRFLYVQVIQK